MGERISRQPNPMGQIRNSHIDLGSINHRIPTRGDEGREPAHVFPKQLQSQAPGVDPSVPRGAVVPAEVIAGRKAQVMTARPTPAKNMHESWMVRYETPWNTYKRGYELKFDRYVTVAVRRFPDSGRVVIKDFDARDASDKLNVLRKISHERFVTVLEVFRTDTKVFAVFDHSFTSLKQVVDSAAFPSRKQLTAILSQVEAHP
jgi:hypothetical protein